MRLQCNYSIIMHHLNGAGKKKKHETTSEQPLESWMKAPFLALPWPWPVHTAAGPYAASRAKQRRPTRSGHATRRSTGHLLPPAGETLNCWIRHPHPWSCFAYLVPPTDPQMVDEPTEESRRKMKDLQQIQASV